MNKSTICVLISIALLPISIQASDFDDITLQIMDADSISHNVINIDFTLPEVNIPDDNLAAANSPTIEAAGTMIVDNNGILPTTTFNDGIGGDTLDTAELPGNLPPNIPGDDIPFDPSDFPEDPDNILVESTPVDPSDFPEVPNDVLALEPVVEPIPVDLNNGLGDGFPRDIPKDFQVSSSRLP